MTTIKCPYCEKEVEINIANAVDENAEVYYCPYCGRTFRYVS